MSEAKILDRGAIVNSIEKGDPIEITFPVLNDTIQEAIHFLVDSVLEKYKKTDLKECIYTTLKELVVNGIKANIKHAVFKDASINQDNPESLKVGLQLLKDIIRENNVVELEKKARANNLHVTLQVSHSTERVIIVVDNNTVITEHEESRIREKFGKAMKYESIADYYMDNLDDSEGQGIGITMIVLMLKGNNIDPHAFTIDMKSKSITRAKIEFPIEEKTIERCS